MALPIVTSHLQDINATSGDSILFSVAADGAGELRFQWQKDGANTNKGIQFALKEHMPQFDRPTRKWIRDGSGNWCYITNQGILNRRGLKVSLGVAAFNDPSTVIGTNYFALTNVTAADAGTYRCVVSNEAGSTTSNGGVLSLP